MTPIYFDDDSFASNPPNRARPSEIRATLRKLLRPVASLQLTVFLFVLSLMLVFFGTLAQINSGLWTVMESYFRSWYVWVPVQLFAEFFKVFFGLDKSTEWHGSFPFPSGNLLGFALLGNLLAAHALRFRMTWKRSGIFLIHSGLIIMMLGEFFTGQMAIESRMMLQLGETSNFIEDSRRVEIAISQPLEGAKLRVITIPQYMLQKPGLIHDDHLPVDIKIGEYHRNSKLYAVTDGSDDDVIFDETGVRYRIVPSEEEAGVDTSAREDAPSVRVEIFKKGTEESLGQFLLSVWQYTNHGFRSFLFAPKTFVVDGATCTIELRNRRFYKTYNVELLKFEHKQHPGTKRAKEYASTVQLRDPENDEDREILIRMNNPLRYQGLTFYQSGVLPDDTGTVLQVVDNPVWILPYISCVVVALGMMIHFGMALTKFQRRRAAI